MRRYYRKNITLERELAAEREAAAAAEQAEAGIKPGAMGARDASRSGRRRSRQLVEEARGLTRGSGKHEGQANTRIRIA